MDGSKAWWISKEELFAWIKWSVIFLAPAGAVFFSVLGANGTTGEAMIALYTWIAMRLTQLGSKVIPDTTK